MVESIMKLRRSNVVKLEHFLENNMAQNFKIPLPKRWPEYIKSATLNAISLARTAILSAQGWAAENRNKRVRLQTELDRANSEIALLKEELSIKDARFKRISPHRRPFYNPIQRLRILKLKAARGWNSEKTAKAFLLNEQTIAS